MTSSNAGLGGIFTGLALSPFRLKEVIGVVKAYTTRVGSGPLPTEQLNSDGEKLQSLGREFGVTTGRRRVRWLQPLQSLHRGKMCMLTRRRSDADG